LYNAINQEIKRRGLTPNFQSLKACISGSAPLHAEIKNNFETLTGAKLMEGYGLSEAPTATHCNPLYGENRVGSIGLPLPDVDCQVVDIIDESRSVACGEIGELLIKGPQVMKAYYYNDVETRQSLKNGWLHTGDIVRMDADGYFYVVDRKKSLIKVSGFQVWPNEVEQVIASHPAIQEVGVGGVPEKEHGEKVIAWVVIKKGLSENENDIYAWCRQNLAPYKIPSEIYFKAELPRTSVGKILRRELIRQYLDMKK
jgi:long-chain acyl-CoA synthetase